MKQILSKDQDIDKTLRLKISRNIASAVKTKSKIIFKTF